MATLKTSKAYGKFTRTVRRSHRLVRVYISLETATPGAQHSSDILRAAVALSVAAMDAYFTDRFCELLVPFIKKNGPNARLVELLADAGLDTEQALQMAGMKRPHRRIRTLVQHYLDRVVTQRFTVIDKLFLCFGIKDLCDNAQGVTGKRRLLRSVELHIERRHKIVHEGDVNDHGRLRDIKAPVTIGRIGHLIEFVSACEFLIDKIVKL